MLTGYFKIPIPDLIRVWLKDYQIEPVLELTLRAVDGFASEALLNEHLNIHKFAF